MSRGRLSLMQNNKHIHRYNGYSVSPSAHQLPDGWFAANLLLTRGDGRNAEPVSYQFDALDYFDSETQALGHATAWRAAGSTVAANPAWLVAHERPLRHSDRSPGFDRLVCTAVFRDSHCKEQRWLYWSCRSQ